MNGMAAPEADPRAAFRRVFPGVMVAMFLAAVDQTILASALPAIVASLGGFADLSWVVVAYLLAATIAGRALARIVWSTAARNIANMTPGKTRRNAARNAS